MTAVMVLNIITSSLGSLIFFIVLIVGIYSISNNECPYYSGYTTSTPHYTTSTPPYTTSTPHYHADDDWCNKDGVSLIVSQQNLYTQTLAGNDTTGTNYNKFDKFISPFFGEMLQSIYVKCGNANLYAYNKCITYLYHICLQVHPCVCVCIQYSRMYI